MDTRKFQGLRVTHVKERLTSYRLQLNDNSIIDIPRIELGGFVPQKGMFVRYRFYRGLILQKIEFDGKTVVNRTPAEIMNLLCRCKAGRRCPQTAKCLRKRRFGFRRLVGNYETADFPGAEHRSASGNRWIFQRCAGL